MRNITEMFENSRTIQEQIDESRIDEGLKDLFQTVKEKFKKLADKVVAYLKYVCVKAGTYFIPVDGDGELMEAISPLTMGQAMKDGKINKNSTFIFMDKEGSKLTGFKSNLKDAAKLYGVFGQDAIAYWEYCATKFESANSDQANINEVKLGHNDPFAKYNTVVDNKMLKAAISRHIRKPLARLMIWGAPGIGKTAILNSVLEELGAEYKDHKLIVKTLSNETPDNFTLPDYIEINGERKAIDIPKTWLPVYKPSGDAKRDQMLDEACGKGLLFIDELSRATAQVQSVILPLINEGTFNGYKMGSGWSIICASNRDEDELAGQTSIGSALSNRFAHIYYEPTVHTWREWADKQGFMSPLLLEWLSMKDNEEFSGGKFYYYDPNETYDGDATTKLMCSPRSWTNAMMDLATCEYTMEEGNLSGFRIMEIPRGYLQMILNEYVPSDAVDSFCSFLDVISKVGDLDAAVESVWKKGGKGLKIDNRTLNSIALPLAQLVICQHGGKKLPSTKEFESLCNWLVDSNSDRLASYVLDIIKNVFFSSLADNMRDKAFLLNKTYKLSNDDEKRNLDLIYKPILSAYGLKSCDDMPDYTPGLKLIRDKYKEIFKASTINGKEALG